jgi:hypothetical protein
LDQASVTENYKVAAKAPAGIGLRAASGGNQRLRRLSHGLGLTRTDYGVLTNLRYHKKSKIIINVLGNFLF